MAISPEGSHETPVTAEQVLDYLDRHFLTLEALAERAQTPPAQILALVRAGCIPPHSYEVAGELTVRSTFGDYALPAGPRRYYHPSVATWIERAKTLAERYSLDEVATRMRAGFAQDLKAALKGRPAPASLALEQAWGYVLDGTWGLCLKEITPLAMVEKTLARELIKDVTEATGDRPLNPADRSLLEAAVVQYDAVTGPFAPHEFPESSRHREINAVVEKYDLSAWGVTPKTRPTKTDAAA